MAIAIIGAVVIAAAAVWLLRSSEGSARQCHHIDDEDVESAVYETLYGRRSTDPRTAPAVDQPASRSAEHEEPEALPRRRLAHEAGPRRARVRA